MTNPVPVPDIPGPREPLCWKQDPVTLTRCDRIYGHRDLHTWEWPAIKMALAFEPIGAETLAFLRAIEGNHD